MRLLIAEDDKSLGLFLSRGLEADGHRVRLAFDGGAAVEAFRQEMPDLTILDLNLPVKDGERALEEIRAIDPDLPVLILTARQELETRVSDHPQDLPLLVDHFMQKMGREAPMKRVDPSAMAKLAAHDWPGNVRELEHVLERAVILAGDYPEITEHEMDFGMSVN